MTYQVRTEQRPTAGGLDGTVYVLEQEDGTARADVWPALGMNCYRWRIAPQGQPLDVLYADPHLFDAPVPTRSGIPVLFPFPNRIRDGHYRWGGKEYRLPLNDKTDKNAIHGFPCRRPWRIVGQGADGASAWITGEFQGSVDATDARHLWPADYRIRLTHRLQDQRLRLEMLVDNPDQVPLPFGLGYHPYLRVPLVPGSPPEHCWVESHVQAQWELVETLPTGKQLPLDPNDNPVRRRRFIDLALDDLFRAVVPSGDSDGLYGPASWSQSPEGIGIRLRASRDFRELVLFTHPNRQAVCLEPYTCITDAINLQQQGVDAGLLVLQPGQQWTGIVELTCGPGRVES